MPRGQKTFEIIIEEAKDIISEHNISFDEIEQNTGVEAEFARILFDPNTKTSENISKIFAFLKLKFESKKLMFQPYLILENQGQYRIRRIIKPICKMYYDQNKDQFFKFSYKLKTETASDVYTDIIKKEMKDLIYNKLGKI